MTKWREALRLMNPLFLTYRRVRQQLSYWSSYLDLDLGGNLVERKTDFTYCLRPLLLLHGLMATRRTLEVLERRLRRDGYDVFSLNLGGLRHVFNTRGIDDVADFVRAKIERLYTRYPGMGPLTIIGHSKGGLIGAYYVKKLGGHRRTRALITLGTPHNGTPMAYLGLPFGLVAPSLAQMTPTSSFIRRLQKGPWPSNVWFTSIYSRLDNVNPFPACLIDTQGLPQLRNVEVDCTHRQFLLRKKAYEVILSVTRAAEASSTPRIALVPEVG